MVNIAKEEFAIAVITLVDSRVALIILNVLKENAYQRLILAILLSVVTISIVEKENVIKLMSVLEWVVKLMNTV